ncbi:hypothetical protein ZIOFF_003988 [Zingiber officinale]|uniref:S-adenosylmethionine transporter n=1 Tax=Zingiber officinale TaxID=94328 RepID=A0A8J5HZC1_ZINOF|nr:hypothetical protein ZIOFF_003988 [Zingiber officinale]
MFWCFYFLSSDGAIAGAAAGGVAEAVLYPIDTIKTRLQAVLKSLSSLSSFRLLMGGAESIGKTCILELLATLQGSCREASAIFVGIYEPTKQKLLKLFPENLSTFAHLKPVPETAGAIGGAVSSFIRVPTEVVKQRIQTGHFTSAPDAIRLIVAKEGFRGLYAARRDLNDPENALIGAFAGAITGAITTPLDVMKTRLMVQGSVNQYNGLLNCAQTIFREEGPAAFLKGIGPRVLWIGIGGSIFFGVLERTKLLLSQKRFDQDLKSSQSAVINNKR